MCKLHYQDLLKKVILRSFLSIISILFISTIFAQTRSNQLIQVLVSPDHEDWTYQRKQDVQFKVTVLKNQVPIAGVPIRYTMGYEKEKPTDTGTLQSSKYEVILLSKKPDRPGFLRCEALVNIDGVEYKGIATAAIAPNEIKITQQAPADLMSFWDKAIKDARKITLAPKMELLPAQSTALYDVYAVSFQHYRWGSRIYGKLVVPKKSGKLPAVVQFPGAGVRNYVGYTALAEKGFITLQIGIHGLPLDQDPSVYSELLNTSLKEYWFYNLDDKDQYYYKRVYLACIRAVDFLETLPQYDPNKLIVYGHSQGGGMTLFSAAMDKRVKGYVAVYPALCDLAGYQHHRAGGWPHVGAATNPQTQKADKLETARYFDAASYANKIQVPGFFTWGYNDDTCPPTSYYSVYNSISASKEVYVAQPTGHWTYPEQLQKVEDWIINFFK
ncbi:acetylxylan esterase [Sphingobacterium paucimobilis]|uniref:Acetyl xylan esterase domain-containing protein n=1 Tax=Sphingobacterium paucimobilis HER1398 TaxID=1346330 RepID=U2I1C5_9SPHI|nr:acetylxylan esterase [Sphingobacterium paucimobilis]ERJ61325.1 hypothetical protein M472_21455 [Sphingobacterium paucimobilis HER1398]